MKNMGKEHVRKMAKMNLHNSTQKLTCAAMSKVRSEGLVSLLGTVPGFLYRYCRFRYYLSQFTDGNCEIDGVKINLKDPNLTVSTAHNLVQGWYENVEREFVGKYVGPEVDVVELGGGIGYITAIVASELDQNSKQIVVEANPNLVSTINNTIEQNGLSVKLVSKAYSATEEHVDLYNGSDEFVTGTIEGSGAIRASGVETTTLQELRDEFNLSEFVLIADIEGSEYELIDTELDILRGCCPTLVIEFHGNKEKIQTYSKRLQNAGYRELENKDDVLVFQK